MVDLARCGDQAKVEAVENQVGQAPALTVVQRRDAVFHRRSDNLFGNL